MFRIEKYSDVEAEIEWNLSSASNHVWREYDSLIWKRGGISGRARGRNLLIREMARRDLNKELCITMLASMANIEFKVIGGGTSLDGDLCQYPSEQAEDRGRI